MDKQQDPMKYCEWAQADDDSDVWETTCGHAFCFNDDGPIENCLRYCGYCGWPLKAEPVRTSTRMHKR